MVEISINRINIIIPIREIFGIVPLLIIPVIMSKAPPMPKLYPVPTKISILLLKPGVIIEAAAPQRAFNRIIPSPQNVNLPLALLPRFKVSTPIIPSTHPKILLLDSLSLLKNTPAIITTINTLIEFNIAALAP